MQAGSLPAAPAQRHRILMVSDFFFPNFGGVENHIYQLSQCLVNQGHKVVVMTHAYGNCSGVRYLTNGLKVYYMPRIPFYAQSTLPTFIGTLRLLRVVLIRERITIVHAHQAFSTLGLEALLQARTMGFKVVFTDHSLFGFADSSSILTNKILKCILADVHHVICVSHTSKENTVLRACFPPHRVSVIPNAVDASEFEPDLDAPRPNLAECTTVVALSRLVYRKGIDILALVIPEVCQRHPNVRFIIGGDGPKKKLLEEMIKTEGIASQVTLVGAVPHERARDFLLEGQIFVNASLTEAFCMAIVEAASVGLLVVSTKVGGVPEVLPSDTMILAEPAPKDLVEALEQALQRVKLVDPLQQHTQVRMMYSWENVATRTVQVYDTVMASELEDELLSRLRRYSSCGMWAGKLFCCLMVLVHLWWRFLEWLQPREGVDEAVDWPSMREMVASAAEGPSRQRQHQNHQQQYQHQQLHQHQPQHQQQQQQQQQQHRPLNVTDDGGG